MTKMIRNKTSSDLEWTAAARSTVKLLTLWAINTFALPPSLLYSTCVANPACIAFTVRNDGGSGTHYQNKGGLSTGYFKLP